MSTEIFIPLKYDEYKENKVTLLKISLKTVKTLERLNKISELRNIKHEQRRLLKNSVRETKKHFSKLMKSLPTEHEVNIYGSKTKEKVIHHRINFHQSSELDEELSKIKEQIKNLNI